VAAALSADASKLVVLGGDLPASTWGNADASSATFTWISAHPWIQPLNGDDLLTFPTAGRTSTSARLPQLQAVPVFTADGKPSGLDSARLQSLVLSSLPAKPKNSIEVSAWQAYLTLTAPGADAGLESLRAQYLWQVRALASAGLWAEHPFTQANCFAYPEFPGQPECILANQSIYAVFEPEGARLTQLFFLDQDGPHQIVGPTSQFSVGLSDPSVWHPELGEGADPNAIMGAFVDSTESWTPYQGLASGDNLTFTSPDGSQVKTFRLTGNALEVNYHLTDPLSTRVSLAVDPYSFYYRPSRYEGNAGPGSWTWGLENGLQVEVRSDASLTVVSFTDSAPYLGSPEIPDQDYPPGHYLPFPFSIITLNAERDFSVRISFK
jgi:hypothetical protein